MSLRVGVPFAVRELRGGLKGFAFFWPVFALVWPPIAACGIGPRQYRAGLAREGATIWAATPRSILGT